MKPIKKIQPKGNTDIDLDMLTQRIREGSKTIITEDVDTEPTEVKPKTTPKTRTITKNEEPKLALPKSNAGRKKQNTEQMHRFAIDLPQWLFDKLQTDANENFSTVRGQIIKLLLGHYKN